MGRLPAPLQKLHREALRARTKVHLLYQRHFGHLCFIHINKCGGTSVEKTLGLPKIHDTARQRIAKIGRDRWDEMLTFALIRHPYAKAVSHYRYRRKTRNGGIVDTDIGLDDWICEAYGERNPRYYDNPLMFQPCFDWVADHNGTILVDRLLKLEEIDTAWPAFCEEAFGHHRPLPHANATARNPRPLGDQLSAPAKDVLARHFAADFEAFDYAR